MATSSHPQRRGARRGHFRALPRCVSPGGEVLPTAVGVPRPLRSSRCGLRGGDPQRAPTPTAERRNDSGPFGALRTSTTPRADKAHAIAPGCAELASEGGADRTRSQRPRTTPTDWWSICRSSMPASSKRSRCQIRCEPSRDAAPRGGASTSSRPLAARSTAGSAPPPSPPTQHLMSSQEASCSTDNRHRSSDRCCSLTRQAGWHRGPGARSSSDSLASLEGLA